MPSPSEPSSADSPRDLPLAGSLLVAHPNLRDPNFRRRVLYLAAHGSDGALGFVLNAPLGRPAAELLPDHADREVLGRIPVFLGGPVGRDQLSFAELTWPAQDPTRLHLRHNLPLDEVAGLLTRTHPDPARLRVRAFVGYAGWSEGQLENELDDNAWVVVKPSADFFWSGEGKAPEPANETEDRSWFRIMNQLGPTYKLLAAAPDDPSLN